MILCEVNHSRYGLMFLHVIENSHVSRHIPASSASLRQTPLSWRINHQKIKCRAFFLMKAAFCKARSRLSSLIWYNYMLALLKYSLISAAPKGSGRSGMLAALRAVIPESGLFCCGFNAGLNVSVMKCFFQGLYLWTRGLRFCVLRVKM